jgi:hypothetical protein
MADWTSHLKCLSVREIFNVVPKDNFSHGARCSREGLMTKIASLSQDKHAALMAAVEGKQVLLSQKRKCDSVEDNQHQVFRHVIDDVESNSPNSSKFLFL